MSKQTAISWCDSTFNPWIGCTKISPACDHCYAARQDAFRKWTPEGWGGPRRRTSAALWKKPGQWNAAQFVQCAACGHRCDLQDFHAIDGPADWTMCPACSSADWHGARRRVFCASLADVFDNQVPPEWRRDLFLLIAKTPHLDWLLLTKRIGNAWPMMQEVARMCGGGERPMENVWLGATICNQEEAERDIPKLLTTPAQVRFLSIEPMLGDVRLGSWLQRSPSAAFAAGKVTADMPAWTRIGSTALDWVICGGESGPHARPMHPDWVRSLRDQCAAAGVPFHFKQWGEWTPGENVERQRGTIDTAFLWDDGWHIYPLNLATDHGHIDDQPDLYRVGTKAAGRLLDGVEHNGFPA